MEWLNENAGLVVLISTIVTVILLIIAICILWGVRNKLAVQKLNFLGFYSTDAETRVNYAELTYGNKSLGEIAIVEIGILNGKVNFDLTSFYRKKCGIAPNVRLVIEQRNSLRFTMSEQELWSVLIDGKKGKVLKKLRLYAVDLTGNIYRGRIPTVQKMLKHSMARVKAGLMPPPPPLSQAQPAPEPTYVPQAEQPRGKHRTATHAPESTYTPAPEPVSAPIYDEPGAPINEIREEDA